MLRSAIIRGPAVVTFNGATFYSKDDIQCEVDEATFEIMTSLYGVIDDRVSHREARITFTPCGEWETTAIGVLWPYANYLIGQSLFGTDTPLVIVDQTGKRLTFQAAAITKSPDVILSATKTTIGSVTFSCIGKDNTPWATADSFVKVETGISFPASLLDPAKIWTAPWSAAWGSSPFDAIETVDGWNISFQLDASPFEIDSQGIIDYTFGKLTVVAKCKPVGIAESALIAALGIQSTGAIRGRSLQAIANNNDLVFSSSGADSGLTVFKAAPRRSNIVFGATANRLGEVEWVATRKLAAGVMQPLFGFA